MNKQNEQHSKGHNPDQIAPQQNGPQNPAGQKPTGQQWHTGPEAGQKGVSGQTDIGPDQGKRDNDNNRDGLREDDRIGPRTTIKPHDTSNPSN